MLRQVRQSAASGQALWDDHWRRFDAVRYDRASLRWDGMLDWVDERADAGLLLEAGCGLGRYLLYAHARGASAVGVDFTIDPLVRIARERPGVRVAAADLVHLPFADARFGTVLCFGVLEHFEHGADEPLAELIRVLRPGGWLVVTVPYANYMKRIRARRGDADVVKAGAPLPAGTGFYQNCFTRAEARGLLQRAGLTVVHERRVSRLFWLLGRRGSKDSRPHDPCTGDSRATSRGRGRRLTALAADLAYHAQWLIPGDLTSHMIAIVGRKPEGAASGGAAP